MYKLEYHYCRTILIHNNIMGTYYRGESAVFVFVAWGISPHPSPVRKSCKGDLSFQIVLIMHESLSQQCNQQGDGRLA